MTRTGIALTILILLAVGGGFGVYRMLFAPIPALAARFTLDDCRKVAVSDAETGAPLIGVEDIALLSGGDLLLSAHDRLLSEAGGGPAEADGLFILSTEDLAGPSPSARRLTLPERADLRPHGISASGDLVAAINRQFGDDGLMDAEILVFELGENALHPLGSFAGLCAANNLAFTGGAGDYTIAVTLDRKTCPETSTLDVLMPEGRGVVLTLRADGSSNDATREAISATSPNGAAFADVDGERALVIAETRRNRLRLDDETMIETPGAPDNLSHDEPGAVIAALHPSLPRLGLYRYGYTDSAPSRIARVDLNGGGVEILYDDPAGEVFSATTVGLLQDSRLIAGSVRDAGLLICEGA
ncbi:hypothetical protein KHP62_07840 [Rhodobacteraceae bacterium NNCM2]|nr:hypothetical protein [Coraliihabitans acroporae]